MKLRQSHEEPGDGAADVRGNGGGAVTTVDGVGVAGESE